MSNNKSEKNKCAHCGSTKIIKIDTIFIEDVNHDIYECKKCSELTVAHLFWEKFSKSKKESLEKRKIEHV